MRKIIVYALLLLFYWSPADAQSTAVRIAESHAARMKDSLSLTRVQQRQLYAINMKLFREKLDVWKTCQSQDSIRVSLQRIENKRDTLYAKVLSPAEFDRYKQRKDSFIQQR